jgi:hypothetical protein
MLPAILWCQCCGADGLCRPLRNHSATWPHGGGSIYSITRLGNRPTSAVFRSGFSKGIGFFGARRWIQRVASAGGCLAVGAELAGVRSAGCPGGSRARAMLTRQPYCDVEIVPSLHSNLAGAASATGGTGAVFSSAAACWGAGASAAGFSSQAQPPHQRETNTAMPIRIWVASRTFRRRCGWFLAMTNLAVPILQPMSSRSIHRPRMIRT